MRTSRLLPTVVIVAMLVSVTLAAFYALEESPEHTPPQAQEPRCENCEELAKVVIQDGSNGVRMLCENHAKEFRIKLAEKAAANKRDEERLSNVDKIERTVDGVVVIGSALSVAEIESIRKVVATDPAFTIKTLVSIKHIAPSEVQVFTSNSRGPLSGGGCIIQLKTRDGNWRISGGLGSVIF